MKKTLIARKVAASTAAMLLSASVSFAVPEQPMEPATAAKAERVKTQMQNRITNQQRAESAKKLKQKRQQIHEAKKLHNPDSIKKNHKMDKNAEINKQENENK